MVDSKRPFFFVQKTTSVSEFLSLLIMPPSKVCPDCGAVVPIRLKLCKSWQHVFHPKCKIEQNLPGKAKDERHVKEQQSLASRPCIDRRVTENTKQADEST